MDKTCLLKIHGGEKKRRQNASKQSYLTCLKEDNNSIENINCN